MRQYYERLVDGARELGLAGQYLSTRSNGGVMSVQQAQDRPVESLLAGPAAGVMGAMFVAERAGFGQIIGMDMGGTSLDVSVVDKEIPISTESHVGDFPVIMPAVDVSSIGAGGGSIAWIDSGGVLKVGPRSAGADPGPACYGKGGEDATITDAYVHLGLLNPEAPLGGRVELHPELAERALAGLGRSLSMKAEEVAQGIIDVATSMMYTELVPMLARRGIDPRDFAFLAYGGAGPTHAFLAAQELNLPTLLIPPAPGTLCALGCLVADLRQDFVTTLTRGAKSMSDGDIADIWRRLETQAADWIGGAPKGVLVGKVALHFSMDMRYAGQSFEIPVHIAPQMRKKVSRIARAFRREYHRLFGVTDLETDTEIVNARVTVVGATSKPILTPPRGRPNAGPQRRRRVRIGGEESQVPIYLRPNLEVGEHVLGPAVIEQDDTTTVVPRGFEVQVDAFGNLIGQRV